MACTVNYLDFNPELVSFSQWKELTLFRYENDQRFFQSPWIEMSHYGIPNKDKYHETDESRMYIKVPITEPDFVRMLEMIDEIRVQKTALGGEVGQVSIRATREGVEQGDQPALRKG